MAGIRQITEPLFQADLVERMAAEESKHASIKEELKVLEDQYQQTKKDYEVSSRTLMLSWYTLC